MFEPRGLLDFRNYQWYFLLLKALWTQAGQKRELFQEYTSQIEYSRKKMTGSRSHCLVVDSDLVNPYVAVFLCARGDRNAISSERMYN